MSHSISEKITSCPARRSSLASRFSGVSAQARLQCRFFPPTTITECGLSTAVNVASRSRQKYTATLVSTRLSPAITRKRRSLTSCEIGGRSSGRGYGTTWVTTSEIRAPRSPANLPAHFSAARVESTVVNMTEILRLGCRSSSTGHPGRPTATDNLASTAACDIV